MTLKLDPTTNAVDVIPENEDGWTTKIPLSGVLKLSDGRQAKVYFVRAFEPDTGEWVGIWLHHPTADPLTPCQAYVRFDDLVTLPENPGELTIPTSIFCDCGLQGRIENGAWISAPE